MKDQGRSLQSKFCLFGGADNVQNLARRCSLVACMIVLSSCAGGPRPTTPHYAKDGGGVTQEQFLQERYICLQQAQQGTASGGGNQYGSSYSAGVITNKQIFISCMAARGYRVDPEGPLVVPGGAAIRIRSGYFLFEEL